MASKFDEAEPEIQELIRRSHEAMEKSYSPYSKFRVGAALVCPDGTMFTGCNVENASYGLAICAERTAIVKAVSEGHQSFKAIAIASDLKSSCIAPCGACRQFLLEFGTNWDVYMTSSDMSFKKVTTGELLPHGFCPSDLDKERLKH